MTRVHRQAGDFQAAVDHWQAALDIDPNQYIWRRRIQQYGPRLDKPYPFYDWVAQSREEIAARGGTPWELAVEPGRSEFAEPLEDISQRGAAGKLPDPEGRIHRDDGEFIDLEMVVVPALIRPGRGSTDSCQFPAAKREQSALEQRTRRAGSLAERTRGLPRRWVASAAYESVGSRQLGREKG